MMNDNLAFMIFSLLVFVVAVIFAGVSGGVIK